MLIGVATPSDLISDPQRTPFNIGRRVDLTDFTFEEAMPLVDGLGLPPEEAEQVLSWAMKWTGGHPCLTQRLCRVIADQDRKGWSEAQVDSVVASIFFGEVSEQDHNLQFVRDMLTRRAPDQIGVLETYREIRRGRRPVQDEEQSLVKSHLKLPGVVCRERDELRVRNPIYEKVFDRRWVKAAWPVHWLARIPRSVKVAAVLITVLLVALISVTADAARQAQARAQLAEAQAISEMELVRAVAEEQASAQKKLAQAEVLARQSAE